MMTSATGTLTGSHVLARYRDEFPIFRDRIYLNSCSLGPLGERSRRKVVEFLDLWQARGAAAWYDVWWQALNDLRRRYGRAGHRVQFAFDPRALAEDLIAGHVRLSPFFYHVQDDHVRALERLATTLAH